jgi:thioredoxin reductase (NADPH)
MDGYDVIVVGAGPIGLEVAWALRREGLSVVNIEAGGVGATIGWWAPGTRFFSSPERIAIAGVPLVTAGQEKATREEYLAYLRGVVVQFGLEVRTFERATAVERSAEGFVVRTVPSAHGVGGPEEGGSHEERHQGSEASRHQGGREYRARRVVMAVGDMQRARMLGVRGEELGHVSHYFQDPHRYVGRRVLIVGGKNSAVEAAIRCCRVGAQVMMSYRGAELDALRVKYWLLPELKGLIKEGRISFVPETLVEEIREEVVVLRRADGGWVEVPADDVLLLTGYVMDGALLEGAGVEMVGEERRPRFDGGTMETNVPGLFVAGTAVAGSQERHRVFIENCHVHAERIAGAVMGRGVRVGEREWGEAES